MLEPVDQRPAVKRASILRCLLWVVIMAITSHSFAGFAHNLVRSPWALVFIYEFAYYLLRTEKAEWVYRDACSRHRRWEEEQKVGVDGG